MIIRMYTHVAARGRVWGRTGPGYVAAFQDSGTVSAYPQSQASMWSSSSCLHLLQRILGGITTKIKFLPPTLLLAPVEWGRLSQMRATSLHMGEAGMVAVAKRQRS